MCLLISYCTFVSLFYTLCVQDCWLHVNKWFHFQSAILFGLLLTISLSGIYLFHPRAIEIFNLKVTDLILGCAKAPEPNLDRERKRWSI
jgi:hypothetical protein